MPNSDHPHPRTIVVVGEGSAAAIPDRCVISASLIVTRASVASAIADVAALADASMAAMRDAGIDDADLATENLGVHDWMDPGQQQVTARVATYTFTIRALTLGEVSELVQGLSAVAGDALRIHGISFSHSAPGPLRAAARRDALADARSRAEQLAEAGKLRLGEVLAIDEGSGTGGQWFARAVSAGAHEMAASMPIQPGGHAVSIRVVVTYALG